MPSSRLAAFAGLVLASTRHRVSATYFGFYGVSPADLNATTAAFSNLFQADSVAEVAVAAALNVTSLLLVYPAFFGAPPGLRPDYKEQWAALEAQARPLVESGAVLGFNLGDELVWNCFDPAAVRAAADLVRASFPRGNGTVVWYNEAAFMGQQPMRNGCGDVVDDFSIPESLDWQVQQAVRERTFVRTAGWLAGCTVVLRASVSEVVRLYAHRDIFCTGHVDVNALTRFVPFDGVACLPGFPSTFTTWTGPWTVGSTGG
jgi:hypothetical protein